MRSCTTSHKNQFSRRLDNKNNCYRELKIEIFIDQNLIAQWGITQESTKRFSFPCRGKRITKKKRN